MAPSMMPTTAPAAAAPSDAIQVTLSVPLFVRPSLFLLALYLPLSLSAPDAVQAAMAATLGTIQLPTSVPPPTTATAPAEAPPAKGFNEINNNNSNGINMTSIATT